MFIFFSNFSLWYPKGSKKNWPKCHSGQSVSGQSVTLAKESLWPKCHSGQSVSGQNVLGQNVILAKMLFWPKCYSGQSVPTKVSLAKVSLWPKCDSAFFLSPGFLTTLENLAKSPSLVDFVNFLWLLIMTNLQ